MDGGVYFKAVVTLPASIVSADHRLHHLGELQRHPGCLNMAPRNTIQFLHKSWDKGSEPFNVEGTQARCRCASEGPVFTRFTLTIMDYKQQ